MISIISFKHITLDKGSETLMHCLFVLDWNTNVKEWLTSFVLMRTILADHFICKSTSKMLLDSLFLRSTLDGSFNSIHEHLEKLFCIHLFKHIHWLSLPILKRVTETFWVYILFFRFHQSLKKILELVEHIFIVSKIIMIWIFYLQKVISKPWNHKELLELREHIANAAKIF